MTHALKTMMDHGLLIFQNDDKYVLQKVSTPTNPKHDITHSNPPWNNTKEFDSWDDAFDFACDFIANDKLVEIKLPQWTAIARYSNGLGKNFYEFNGDIYMAKDTEAAKEMAKRDAEKWAEEQSLPTEILEIKIRPAR